MKKLGLMILPALFLTACDRPMTDELEIRCPDNENFTEEVCKIQLFKDKLIYTKDNQERVYALDSEASEEDVGSRSQFLKYVSAEKEFPVHFDIYFDTNTSKIYQISAGIGNSGVITDVLPDINHGFPKLNEQELCIEKIGRTVFFESDENKLYIDTSFTTVDGVYKFTPSYISAEDAVKLSANWDYKDMKFYDNSDRIVHDYEKDACETLERLNQYIKDNNLKK